MYRFYISSNYLSRNLSIFFYLTVPLFFNTCANAQLNPLGAVYYQNQYMVNPAMAGFEKGTAVNLSYRKQLTSISNSPKMQSFSVDHGFNKVGLGINFLSDRAGILQKWKLASTYAYHLSLDSSNTAIHFGLSLTLTDERLNVEDIQDAELNDPSIDKFNQRGVAVDSDFGLGLTSGKFVLQAAVSNVRKFLKADQSAVNAAGKPTFFTAISYKISTGIVKLEPKLVYRGLNGDQNIWDIGTRIGFADEKFQLLSFYHTNKSFTAGLALRYNSKLMLNAFYTANVASVGGYTRRDMEVSLKVRL